MYCPKCGKPIKDGENFCGFCGAPLAAENASRIPASTPSDMIKTEKDDNDIPKSDVAHIGSKGQSGRKNVTFPVAAGVMIVLVIVGVFLISNAIGNPADNVSLPIYALPELPDALIVRSYTDTDADNCVVVGSKVLSGYNGYSAQIAEDGTIAVQTDDNAEVHIFGSDGTQIGTIPAPVEYFYLCGSGAKIAYGSDREITYVWDVSSGESELISERYGADGISYSGDALDMDRYYRLEGQEPVRITKGWVLAMSPDGKYIYYGSHYADGSGHTYSLFGVYIDGKDYELFRSSDLNYYPYVIAVSSNYKEVVFNFGKDVYCFSVDSIKTNYMTNYTASHVNGVKNGILIALNNVLSVRSMLGSRGDDTVYSWLDRGYPNYDYDLKRTVNSVFDSPYCLLKEENGIYSVSLVKLVDTQIVELIPDITGNICLSADETKLWCVADGRLAFCDLSMDEPHVLYCDTAYVRTYGSDDGRTPFTAPIAMTSDGSTACFVGYDGTLWMCTPETINAPTAVTDDAVYVKCSSDDTFYIVKGDYLSNDYGELYLIDQNEAIYQYDHVVDIHMTKSDVYIIVESEDQYGDFYYALSCKNKEGYRLLINDCGYSADYIYWGES